MAASVQFFKSWGVLVLSAALALVAAQSNWLGPAEDGQRAFIAQLMPQHASQQIHIVELDAISLERIPRWPWPRDYYARVVENLDSAGVRSIVFDVEFSSSSTPDGDQAFADAIANADAPIVLPTFAQAASENSTELLDALPIPILRENASIASASVLPDPDARVRRMVYGTITDGLTRPSLSAELAGVSGMADTFYPIDFSIDPGTIPRHSFSAVELGDFDPAELAGKDIVIGATAIQLGDRYGVPNFGVIPGVTIQTLAAETLINGVHMEVGALPLIVLAFVLAAFVARAYSYTLVMMRVVGTIAVIFLAQTILYHGFTIIAHALPAAVLVVLAGIGRILMIARWQFQQRALKDSESGLPNALAFAQSEHKEGQFVATAFIKDFDAIQSVLGKAEVGPLLERVVDRLRSSAEIEAVYRADTRILAWKHTGDDRALISAFEFITEAMQKPIETAGKRIDVALAFGIASADNISDASRAASAAAQQGKLWHAHEDAEAAMVEQRVSLMGELDAAVAAGELDVIYQPKLRLATDMIESVEALVRWDHPVRGKMRPDHFIPLAEETNRIDALTLYVLRKTIADLKAWNAQGINVSGAVNISALLISSEEFVVAVEAILRDANLPLGRLIFEVTESATMREPEVAALNLERFCALGVTISMDDYGTGQSTLNYLKQLPLSELKIDRTFVQHAHIDKGDAMLVRSTVQLAHELGLRVVAEGIEDADCLAFLRSIDCDYAQGYYIAHPLSADALREFASVPLSLAA